MAERGEGDAIVQELYMLGFERRWVDYALQISNGKGDHALEWLLSSKYEEAVKADNATRAKASQGKVVYRKKANTAIVMGAEEGKAITGPIPSAPPPPFNPDYVPEGKRIAALRKGSSPRGKFKPSSPRKVSSPRHVSPKVVHASLGFGRKTTARNKPSFVSELTALAPSKRKVRVNVRVGLAVLVFSQSAQDWIPGKIDKLQDDLVRIVYGESQKWLPKVSKVWRPMFQEEDQKEEKKSMDRPTGKPQANARFRRTKKDYEVVFAKGNPDFDVISDVRGIHAYVGKIRSQATKQRVKEGSQIMVVQQTVVEGLESAEVLMILAKCVIGNPLRIIFRRVDKPVFHGIYPNNGEQDYEVVFTESFLGLELMQLTKDGRNAIVRKRHSDLAKRAVTDKSYITSINNKWVCNEQYDTIKDVLKDALTSPPTVITFRAPVVKAYGQNERGILLVKVVAALNLISSANYAQVTVGDTKLNTRSRKKGNNVEWQEKLAFKNYRPELGKTAVVSVFETRALLGDNLVGSCEFELPTRFSNMKRETLELKNKKGRVSGLIVLQIIITPNPSWGR